MSVLARFDKEKAPDFSDARFSHQGFYDGSNGKEACCGFHLERFPAGLNLFLAMGGFLTAANQIRSSLSVAARTNMAKGYSTDLRTRAVALVEAGESRREVARLLDLAASTTIRWMDLWQTTGSVAAKPGTGHCHSPLEQHEQWLLDLVTAEPDLTLDEIGTRLASTKKLKVGRTSVWRFYDRHRITFKKNTARRRTGSA
jgi:transposase